MRDGLRIIVPRGRGIAGWVREHNEPLLVPDAYADPRFFADADKKEVRLPDAPRFSSVPLQRGGKEIGVLQVLNPLGHDVFDETDLEAFRAYGNLAATAIDKLRTIERQRQQDRVAQEFAFAREIQASFLPQSLAQPGACPLRRDLSAGFERGRRFLRRYRARSR